MDNNVPCGRNQISDAGGRHNFHPIHQLLRLLQTNCSLRRPVLPLQGPHAHAPESLSRQCSDLYRGDVDDEGVERRKSCGDSKGDGVDVGKVRR